MRRVTTLTALLVVGTLSIAAAGYQTTAQGTARLRVQLLNPGLGLYAVTGGGGNSIVFVRDEDVVVVDTKVSASGPALLDVIGSITENPVTTIINTHGHADHVGGNVEFPAATRIVAQEHTRTSMQKMTGSGGPEGRFVPTTTVGDRLTLSEGPDRIDLYHFGPGHTNGDLIVVFPRAGVAHLGDLFPSKAAPFIDTANGGSGVAFPETLAKAVKEIKGIRSISTGHDDPGFESPANRAGAARPRSYLMPWSDLQEYADFNRDFLEAVRKAFDAEKTPEEAAATLVLPERYKDYDMQRSRANVLAIYNELRNRAR
jgi:glyoxylase-like metal-dependent hydrolase (beta-lactamase superfamily II)